MGESEEDTRRRMEDLRLQGEGRRGSREEAKVTLERNRFEL